MRRAYAVLSLGKFPAMLLQIGQGQSGQPAALCFCSAAEAGSGADEAIDVQNAADIDAIDIDVKAMKIVVGPSLAAPIAVVPVMAASIARARSCELRPRRRA